MKILFVHQNFPGQFLHLAPELERRGHEVRALTDASNTRQFRTQAFRYKFQAAAVDPGATRLGRNYTTMSDRGVVVILDKRVLTKKYGRQFIESLPTCTTRVASAAELPQAAARWLNL